jgi:hypothetical protein
MSFSEGYKYTWENSFTLLEEGMRKSSGLMMRGGT